MSTPPEGNQIAPGTLPTPFSSDEIREACRPGRFMSYRIEEAGADPVILSWEFIAGDGESGVSRRWATTPAGAPLGDETESTATWLEFQEHASYPEESTTLSEETIDLPAGSFDCWLYVSSESTTVTSAWFARSIPGPPVRVVTTEAGTQVHSMELLRYRLP